LTAVVGTVGAGESHRCLHRSHCLHWMC
jgi:hypothetical protein